MRLPNRNERARSAAIANLDRLLGPVRSGRLEVVVNNGEILMVDIIPFAARERGYDHRHIDRTEYDGVE